MKTTHFSTLATVIFAIGVINHQADAGISITNFNLTTNSFICDISGTMPDMVPVDLRAALFFVNSNVTEYPGFTLPYNVASISSGFTGSQALKLIDPVGIGAAEFGDFIFVNFANELSAGESVSGTLTATWSGTVFDPSAVDTINVYWGSDGGSSESDTPYERTIGGTLVTTVPVPEPSTFLLAILGFLAISLRPARN